ncbi:hypothetical protein UFOVP1608_18 [uncultured Caudovirales phage]|uniref:Uncharacterized protein n=1 Tax=uncultured Caudovirales phage TaxID=2100421 RepID=A0A6J5ST69_9CAUD|nr:hypothetical protein UFOVP1608_18 [uncultured Caudovirales phage]
MYPASTEFKTTIRGSHNSVVAAQVWADDVKLLDLYPLDGSVSVDSRRAVRRTFDLTLTSPDPTTRTARATAGTYAELAADYATYTLLSAGVGSYGVLTYAGDVVTVSVDEGIVPDDAFDILAPFGNEIRLWRGATVNKLRSDTYADISGSTYTILASTYATYGVLAQAVTAYTEDELIPLGVFLLTNVEIEAGDGGVSIQASGSDRSVRISRARWTQPYTIAAGTDLGTAIQNLLTDRWIDVPCRFSATTETINKAVFGTETDNDPWRDAQGIAKSAGYDLYFDADGYAVLTAIRDAASASPNAVYAENEEAMVLKLNRSLSNEQTYNGVIVTAEGTEVSDTFREEAWDDDLSSPTYRYGKFGQVPFFYSSPLITTSAQAQSAASGLLAAKKGATENVAWSQIVDPSLDAADVVAVTNADAKVDRLMVIDRLTIPLDAAGTMSAVARTVRSLNGETFEDVA